MKNSLMIVLAVIFSPMLALSQSTVHYDDEIFSYNGTNVYDYGLMWYQDPTTTAYGPMAYLAAYGGLKFFTTNGPKAVLDYNGRLGIATMSPAGVLDAFGNSFFGTGSSNTELNLRGFNGSVSLISNNSGASFNYNGLTLSNNLNGANNLSSWTLDIGGADNINFHNGDSYTIRRNNNEYFRVNSAGNVGIGTTAPDQKLTVNGTIHSQAVKVDMNIPGPDYVFKKNYKMPELNDVKRYITKNHHLSEIPSAAQMAKNGVDLGEMNIKLLKKVEELTLYLIDKDIKDKQQEKEIKDLKQQFVTFKNHNRIRK